MMYPKDFFNNIYERLEKGDVCSLFIAVISGILIHFHILTTRLPNPDVLWETPYKNGHAWEISLGRWGLGILDLFKHNLISPTLSILTTIILLAIIGILLIRCFQIKNRYAKIFICLLLECYPMIGETLTYFYCSDNYMVAFLLSVISFLLLTHECVEKKSYLLSLIFLTLSISIYQSFLGVYIALVIIDMLNRLLFSFDKIEKVFGLVFRCVIIFVCSLALYFIISNCVRVYFGLETASYRGMDYMFDKSVFEIPSMIKNAYMIFIKYFFGDDIFNNSWWNLNIIYMCCFALIIGCIFKEIIVKKIYKDSVRLSLVIVICCLMPVFFCAIVFLASDTRVSYLMVPQMILVFIELIYFEEQNGTNLFAWSSILVICVVIISWIQLDNAMYNAMEIKYDKTYSTATRIIEKLEEHNEFNYSQPVAIIGYVENNIYPSYYPQLFEAVHYTVGETGYLWQDSFVVSQTSWYYFIQRYLGITLHYCNSEEELTEIYNSDQYKQMKCFPDVSSVSEINGVVVVKLSDY